MVEPKKGLYSALSYSIAALACLLFFSPILWVALMSFKTDSEIYRFPPTLLPDRWYWGHYTWMGQSQALADYALNSAIISVVATAITVGCGILAAFAIARYRFIGGPAALMAILILRMVPPIGLTVPLYRMARLLDLIDTRALLIVLNAAVALPSAVWILATFFRLVPKELEEAARLDGCGHLSVLLRIIVPISLPSIATVTIFTFATVWNEYLFASTFGLSRDSRPLTVFLAEMLQPEHQVSWGRVAAVATLVALPTLIIAVVLQRYVVAGLTAGGVKG